MKVMLDQETIEVEHPSLAAALAAGVALAESRGRTIIEVLVDGSPVRGEDLDNVSNDPLPDAEVRMLSAEPVELVRQSLFDAAEALESACDDHTEIANRFQAGADHGQAMELLGSTLSVWQGVQDVLARGYALLDMDPDAIELPAELAQGRQVSQLLVELGEHLREVRRSLEDQDYASLADTIGYELEPLARIWSQVLKLAAEGCVG
ncbi:MAG TPA: hypothetical protein ENJ00_06315, partial [Phycisphaerales bacterium]|nr:hypothetical protein [Phycisphaerales bacterium]